MHRIGKKFKFEASHQLNGLPEGHQCSRLHGHSYEVEVTFVGEGLAKEGWLFDFGDLKFLKDWFASRWDHRHLNDLIDQPTSEKIAEDIFRAIVHFVENEYLKLPEYTYLEKVRVSETDSTYAEYFGV